MTVCAGPQGTGGAQAERGHAWITGVGVGVCVREKGCRRRGGSSPSACVPQHESLQGAGCEGWLHVHMGASCSRSDFCSLGADEGEGTGVAALWDQGGHTLCVRHCCRGGQRVQHEARRNSWAVCGVTMKTSTPSGLL